MRHFKLLFLLSILLLSTTANLWANNLTDKRPNILFVMVDDLRVEPDHERARYRLTPNIDALAAQGTRFANAYVSVPVCGASRASLFTGLRATRARFKNYHTRVDRDAPNAITLFEQFKNHGYRTQGFGKIFHQANDSARKSWTSAAVWMPGPDQKPQTKRAWRDYQRQENIAQLNQSASGPATETVDGPDEIYYDGQIAHRALAALAELADGEQQFLLDVGFVKPHLPFNAPSQYWDLYDAKHITLPANELPEDAPDRAYHPFAELRAYSDIPAAPDPIGERQSRHLIHGYYAAVSYVDEQIGKLLTALNDNGMADNTIVIVMGDHGFSLGEHGLWCKHSTFDVATKAPLIIRAPGMPENQTVEGLVEFIDIYPTLVELAGLPAPAALQGSSMVSLLANADSPAKPAVFPRYRAAEAIRTEQYTLTQWFDIKGEITATMLYDNKNDPAETRNLANQSQHKALVKKLSQQLAAHIASRQ